MDPLLDGRKEAAAASSREDRKELLVQLKLGGPFVISALLSFSKTLVTLAFVGQLGQQYLAAAGLATALWKREKERASQKC